MAAPIVTVFRNGDATFPGRKLVVNRRQIRTMDALLDKVTKDTRMMHAARTIKTPTGKHTIKQLDGLESGGCYVAMGAERFKRLPYTEIKSLQGNNTPRKEIEITPVKHSKLQMSARARKVADAQSHNHKTIHVFRNGDDLYPSMKMLLDKRDLISMDRILRVVTTKVRLQSGAVFWLFTVDGKEIKEPTELENGGQYVAVGHGKKFKKVAYTDGGNLLSPRSRAPTKTHSKIANSRPNKSNKTKNAASKGHKRKSSSTSNSQASSHEEHHPARRPTDEIQEMIKEKIQEEFIAQPPAQRSPTPTNTENVYQASGENKEKAREVQDDREVREDKPIDQMAAEEVEEEELENEPDNNKQNDKNEAEKEDEAKKDEERSNSGLGGFLGDLIDDVREKFDDDDDDDDVKKNSTDQADKDDSNQADKNTTGNDG